VYVPQQPEGQSLPLTQVSTQVVPVCSFKQICEPVQVCPPHGPDCPPLPLPNPELLSLPNHPVRDQPPLPGPSEQERIATAKSGATATVLNALLGPVERMEISRLARRTGRAIGRPISISRRLRKP
jgi:hypothetical protein